MLPVALLQPQIPGSRRVVPTLAGPTVVANLGSLLEQDEVWVSRARWYRWLVLGRDEDTMPIASMVADDRLASRAWLRQQRHVLHRTLVGGSDRAPEGWIERRPLFRALAG